MTDQDPCRVMAETMWVRMVRLTYPPKRSREEWINETAENIRNHTALPDLVEANTVALRFQEVIDEDRVPEAIRGEGSALTIKLRKSLAKAHGRKE